MHFNFDPRYDLLVKKRQMPPIDILQSDSTAFTSRYSSQNNSLRNLLSTTNGLNPYFSYKEGQSRSVTAFNLLYNSEKQV